MKVTQTEIAGILILEPIVYEDARGYFYESFNQQVFAEVIGQKITFVQDNQSCSQRGVLRGLHYQLPPMAQCKLVRCLAGEIYDVVVDIRRNSPTFGQWLGFTISAENKKQLWIPEGFAHGFVTLSDTAEVLYKVTQYWSREYERCISWSDQELDINWLINSDAVLASEKDQQGCSFTQAVIFA